MAYKEISSSVNRGKITENTDLSTFIIEKTKELGSLIYLLVFKHNEVQIGLIRDGNMKLDRQEELAPSMIKELRAFSSVGELYIWSQGEELKYRLRIDGNDGEKLHSYEEEHYMWGTHVQRTFVIEENRGMKYTMPFPAAHLKMPLKYTVKNYYTFDELGLIQFQDARLVQFLNCSEIPLS